MSTLAVKRSSLAIQPSSPGRVAGFRTKVLVAMMLVVSAVTAVALYFAQRNLTENVQRDLEREFHGELDALHKVREIRQSALRERCRALVRKSRIHAALEDNAEDRLYPSAADELRDVMQRRNDATPDAAADALQARFFRFLDRHGAVIPLDPPDGRLADVAARLSAAEVAQLRLPSTPEREQIGFIEHSSRAFGSALAEVITLPIRSTDSGEVIGGLALGFKPFEFEGRRHSGIWLKGKLHSTSLSAGVAEAVEVVMSAPHPAAPPEIAQRLEVTGTLFLMFARQLNPGSQFPLAYEVCVFPLADLIARQRQLRWQVLGAGGMLLLVGLAASHFAAVRLSAPVEKLAVDSERSARFSADASHQLKTPVTVLRAGLEELLARDSLTAEECDQVSALIHQTYRLSTLIEDLLLLSRMDAGRVQIEAGPVNLTQLIEASVDDLGALPDELSLDVETDFPRGLIIRGEKRYTSIVLQNLLENARKYNRSGGRIRVTARRDGDRVQLSVGNTGRTIAAAAQAHIFERFHRGAIGENVPGYGLGLNLARELARLHHGDLRLLISAEDWTEFEVTFRAAEAAVALGGER